MTSKGCIVSWPWPAFCRVPLGDCVYVDVCLMPRRGPAAAAAAAVCLCWIWVAAARWPVHVLARNKYVEVQQQRARGPEYVVRGTTELRYHRGAHSRSSQFLVCSGTSGPRQRNTCVWYWSTHARSCSDSNEASIRFLHRGAKEIVSKPRYSRSPKLCAVFFVSQAMIFSTSC